MTAENKYDVVSLANSKTLSEEVWNFQNEVRKNPRILIPLLEGDLKKFVGRSIFTPGQPGFESEEGPRAWQEAIEFVQAHPPVHPLEWSDALSAAAIDHAYDMGPRGGSGHMGSDMSTLSDRVARHGTWLANVAENIFAGCADPIEIIKQLVIDDGVASRGDRANIFNPDFHAVGIGAAPHPDHACMCVIDYAGGMAPGGTAAGYVPAVGPAVFDIATRSEARLADARATAGALPAGCVSRSVEVCTHLADARRTVTTTTLYQFADGHKESRTAVEET